MVEQISDFIRALRRELSMTQEELAHELGITVGTVNRWENGRFRPSKLARATIVEFAQRHGVSVEALQKSSIGTALPSPGANGGATTAH